MQPISNSNNNQPSISQEGYVDENPINITAMLHALWAYKQWLLLIAGIGVVFSVIIALLQPKYFTAQIRIMPPINNGGGGQAALLSALGNSGGSSAASMLGLKSPGELYVGLLKSRSVTDHIINKFSLKEVYEIKTFQKTRLQLFNFTKVTAGKDGIISVDVEDKDPKRAADVANEYFYALQNMMQRMAVTEAGQRRLFFETQLKQAKNQLTDAEEAFKTMQQTTGVLQLDAQGKVAIEAVAKMRAAISAKEVELASLRQYATPENPEYQRKASEMAALRNEFNKLERSQTGDNTESEMVNSNNNKKLTDSGLDYARRLRDLKYAETVFELLAKQFEFARLDESRETASLQLIDEAVVPELPSRPNRLLFVITGSFFSILLAIAAMLLKTRKKWLNP
jgi:tyrosine-protein kinase Etk/Wzc